MSEMRVSFVHVHLIFLVLEIALHDRSAIVAGVRHLNNLMLF